MKKISTFDIETLNWNEFLMAGYYDGERYEYFENLDSALCFFSGCKEQICYAHNGGKFDFLFLFDAMIARNIRPSDIILVNGSIISFRFGNVTFRDSLVIMPRSLRKLAELFGDTKLEINYDELGRDEKTKAYLKQDCIALYNILHQYFGYMKTNFGVFPGLTLASTAMKIYRSNYNQIPFWGQKYSQNKSINSAIETKVRQAYVGGRCEIFKLEGRQIRYYDINSLYPYVMRKHTYPVGKPKIITKGYNSILDSDNSGIIEATVTCPDIYIPLLPIKIDNKLLYLKGKIHGVWTLAEMRAALGIGYKLHDIDGLVVWPKRKHIFRRWVDDLYQRKKHSTNNSEIYLTKLLLNSLYGKFGERKEKEEIVFLDDNEKWKGITILSISRRIGSREKISEAQHMIPILATYVTSFSRLEIYKYLDTKSYYCDTDSVFTESFLDESVELGGMKLEDNVEYARFILPKLYEYRINGERKIKAKGFHQCTPTEFDRLIQKESLSEEKLLSFKQCLISHKQFTAKRILTKSIKSDYNKRHVLNTGDTEPHTQPSYEKETKNYGLAR